MFLYAKAYAKRIKIADTIKKYQKNSRKGFDLSGVFSLFGSGGFGVLAGEFTAGRHSTDKVDEACERP